MNTSIFGNIVNLQTTSFDFLSVQFIFPLQSKKLMSLQTNFNSNTNTMNFNQTSNGVQTNSFFNQTPISKKQQQYKIQAALFLKRSLTGIIKDELKAYRLQKKLHKQMQDFKKIKDKKQIISDLHKIQKFRQQESENLKSKFDTYIKEKQKRDCIAEEIVSRRNQDIQRKKEEHEQRIQSVRSKHFNNEAQQIKNRLSRAESGQSNPWKNMAKSKLSSSARNIHSSVNRRDLIHSRIQDEQQARINNYLKKMKQVQSRILQRQLKNQDQKQKSIKNQVRNLTKERDLKQQSRMKLCEQKFQSKMGSFYQNFNKSKMENSSLLMNRSMVKSKLRQRVVKNKQSNYNKLINTTMNNFMRKNSDKQNINSNYQRQIDLMRTKSSFMSNTIQIEKQALQKQNSKNLRTLYEKLERIKRMRPNESLSQKHKQQLLNLLNAEDPLYAQIVQFLSNSKSQFLKKKIEKQQQKAKAQKTKKTARFYNKN